MLQELDFSQCSLRQDLLAEDVCDFLDSDTFPCLAIGRGTMLYSVSGSYLPILKPVKSLATSPCTEMRESSSQDHVPHDAISALPQFFCDIISLINNEILVENLEILATSHVRHLVATLACAADRLGVRNSRRGRLCGGRL